MTTIAYRDGVLAADSRITAGNLIVPGGFYKIRRLPCGSLFAGCGIVDNIERLLESIISDDDPPSVRNTTAVQIDPKGSMWTYEGYVWVRQRGPYGAWGSGSAFAYGALAMGASAKDAVRVAIKFDSGSGGPVRAASIKENARA